MQTESRRWRWWVTGLALAALVALCWWLLSEDVRVEEPAVEAPVTPSPPRIVAPSPIVEVVPDAGTSPEEDASEEATTVRTRSQLVWLGPRNSRILPPSPNNDFQNACRREAEACERFLVVGEGPPFLIFTFSGESGRAHVSGLDSPSDEKSEFAECMVRGLKPYTFAREPTGSTACLLREMEEKRSSLSVLIRGIVKCVGTDASAGAISVKATVRVVDGRVQSTAPEVTSLNRLDLSTESCIRLAAQQGELVATPEQAERFTTYVQSVTVVLAGEQPRERVDVSDVKGRLAVEPGYYDLPTPTPESIEAATRLADDAEAALRRNDAAGAKTLARQCLTKNRDELRCDRAKAFAWLSLQYTHPDALDEAVIAWLHFVRNAPAGDPDVARVRLALTAAGWRE